MMRSFMLLACIAATASSASAPPAATLTCQSCTHSVAELLKQVPVLTRTKGVREGDKELALGDALPSMCAGNVFSGLASAPELAAACKAFAVPGGAIEAALLAGKPAAEACAALCEGVAEGERKPAAKAAPKAPKGGAASAGGGAKGAKATPKFREGSVDDPRVKAALKAKAARDARKGRGKKPAAEVEEVEEGAGDL
jgi:hypothetical protein